MKPLLHEKILGIATLLFIVLTVYFSVFNTQKLNIASGSEQRATPYLIDINTATVDELDTLDGIGSKTAVKIVEYREKYGEFKTKDELCNVSGIGHYTLDKIKDYIKV